MSESALICSASLSQQHSLQGLQALPSSRAVALEDAELELTRILAVLQAYRSSICGEYGFGTVIPLRQTGIC